ncbi:putative ABC transport system ATP-binding protein [Persephonella hydrogeniphila]|uniref:Putative ABC transport system ATP-binding protein n=1 Tax=Persephonella hydrogeniphila TaxID=198703 RepID=A0A285MZY6_9AQUI|nr:ABC transporter ATP-binding protein [Persephonella hydrogeniphila]SNZ02765.1 putative ABC transport system ATP-binding protein [Persephonella hydrogeniphila]
MKEIIKLEDITKVYETAGIKTEALKGISLTVYEGEFLSIMGTSGSGKTTLMNIIGCLDTPTSGKYYLLGKDVSQLDDDHLSEIRNRYIGFVFQQFFLIPYLTALENILVPAVYSKEKFSEKEKEAEKLLDMLGLKDKKNNKPSQLSGGQQQRVAIGRALINNPELILADEPTGALDSKTAKEIMNIFVDLNKKGKTIILITHDPQIASYAHRIIKISDGKITT